MKKIFISYASGDADFAELAKLKLEAEGIEVWLDQGKLYPGEDWRNAIDEGILSSDAMIVVLSPRSSESSYVTYEWAYALGNEKPIIPILLEETKIHPRLEAVQYLDFRNPKVRPWQDLLEEINHPRPIRMRDSKYEIAKTLIIEYLDRNKIQMVGFDIVRKNIDPEYDDRFLMDVIRKYPAWLRRANLKGDRLGVGKR
ncbi:toll/interleukin-1 receptor domain-containing protein [bacterium]|nr:toll/interleukin-1 receptor domain-containing protein [bacterium]